MSYKIITEKCPKCGKEFHPYVWNPHYDAWGMMGNGWEYWSWCEKCREKEEDDD